MSTLTARTLNVTVAERSIVWTGGLTEQQKNDVLESTLFAQAAADKRHHPDDEKEALAWYHAYCDVIGSIGWIVQGSSITDLHYHKEVGSIHDTVLQSLADDDDVDKTTLSLAARAMMAYSRVAKDSPASGVFEHAGIASSSHFASFQIVVASINEGDLTLTVWSFFYSSDQKIGHALWHPWKNGTLSIKTSKLVMTLNSGLYAQIRDTVHQKLDGAGKLNLLVPLCE